MRYSPSCFFSYLLFVPYFCPMSCVPLRVLIIIKWHLTFFLTFLLSRWDWPLNTLSWERVLKVFFIFLIKANNFFFFQIVNVQLLWRSGLIGKWSYFKGNILVRDWELEIYFYSVILKFCLHINLRCMGILKKKKNVQFKQESSFNNSINTHA